jgi:hypothetical protein
LSDLHLVTTGRSRPVPPAGPADAAPPPSARVVLAGLPRLTQELVRGVVAGEAAIEVVDDRGETTVLREAVENGAQSSVVVVGTGAPAFLAACREALAVRARLRVLALRDDGREAQLYGLRSYESRIEELSLELLAEFLREERLSD